MKKLIVVADWAADHLTCQEIRTTVEGFLDNPAHPVISFVESTPSTIHTAYLIDQITETEERYGRPLDTVIFQGSDSVVDNPEGLSKIWSPMSIVRLKSGLHIIGANTGYVYSLIKPKIEVVFHYPGLPETGSFRARDVFSRVVAHLLESKQDNLELEEIHTNLIPELQDSYVSHIDSFGNIITTAKETVLKQKYTYGDQVPVTINGVTKTAEYVKSLFDGMLDGLIVYPGTTGPHDDPYLEVSKYVDVSKPDIATGLHEFNNPKPGMKVQLG